MNIKIKMNKKKITQPQTDTWHWHWHVTQLWLDIVDNFFKIKKK